MIMKKYFILSIDQGNKMKIKKKKANKKSYIKYSNASIGTIE